VNLGGRRMFNLIIGFSSVVTPAVRSRGSGRWAGSDVNGNPVLPNVL